MVFYTKNSNTPFIYNDALKDELAEFELVDMIDLSVESKYIKNIVHQVWEECPAFNDNIMDNDDLPTRDNTYFICFNAHNFRSLKLKTSEVPAFNKATKDSYLNLETLYLINDPKFSLNKLIPMEFLLDCQELEVIRICYPIAPFYMGTILQVQDLIRLEISHQGENDDTSDLLKTIIDAKGKSIMTIQTPINNFPPRWLNDSVMEKCEILTSLILKDQSKQVAVNQTNFNVEMPAIKSLEMLSYIGEVHCLSSVMKFIVNCPNIKYFHTYPYYFLDMYENTIVEWRQRQGNDTPFSYKLYTEPIENVTKIEFFSNTPK